jgi:hypothetical protein
MLDLLVIEQVTKMKPGSSNSVEDHPQLSHNRHPVDGALVGAGSLWPHLLVISTSLDTCACSLFIWTHPCFAIRVCRHPC